jgi:hypothetical protein
LVPPIDAIVGHWFAGGEVHIVFAGKDGRQFFLVKETLERVFGDFLEPSQIWSRRENPVPLRGVDLEEARLRAFHEAGHAVVCVDEAINVEFVTIIPSTGWNGQRQLGFCQYDYRLPEALKNDRLDLAEKTARTDMGGPWADHIFRQRNGLPTPEAVRYAWEHDRREARKRIADKAFRLGKKINLDLELDRLSDMAGARLQEAWAWSAVTGIANQLCQEGAISGQVAKEIVEQAKVAASLSNVEENHERRLL